MQNSLAECHRQPWLARIELGRMDVNQRWSTSPREVPHGMTDEELRKHAEIYTARKREIADRETKY